MENIGSKSFTSFSPKKIAEIFTALNLPKKPLRSQYRLALFKKLKEAKHNVNYQFAGYNYIELIQILVYLDSCYTAKLDPTINILKEKTIPRFGYNDKESKKQNADQVFVFRDYCKIHDEHILDSYLEFSQNIELVEDHSTNSFKDFDNQLMPDILPDIGDDILCTLPTSSSQNKEKESSTISTTIDHEIAPIEEDMTNPSTKLIQNLTTEVVEKFISMGEDISNPPTEGVVVPTEDITNSPNELLQNFETKIVEEFISIEEDVPNPTTQLVQNLETRIINQEAVVQMDNNTSNPPTELLQNFETEIVEECISMEEDVSDPPTQLVQNLETGIINQEAVVQMDNNTSNSPTELLQNFETNIVEEFISMEEDVPNLPTQLVQNFETEIANQGVVVPNPPIEYIQNPNETNPVVDFLIATNNSLIEFQANDQIQSTFEISEPSSSSFNNQIIINKETSENILQQLNLMDRNITFIVSNDLRPPLPTEIIDDDGFVETYKNKCSDPQKSRLFKYYCTDKDTNEKINLKQIRQQAKNFVIINQETETCKSDKCGYHPNCNYDGKNRINNVIQHISSSKYVAICCYCQPPKIVAKYANIGRHFKEKHLTN